MKLPRCLLDLRLALLHNRVEVIQAIYNFVFKWNKVFLCSIGPQHLSNFPQDLFVEENGKAKRAIR